MKSRARSPWTASRRNVSLYPPQDVGLRQFRLRVQQLSFLSFMVRRCLRMRFISCPLMEVSMLIHNSYSVFFFYARFTRFRSQNSNFLLRVCLKLLFCLNIMVLFFNLSKSFRRHNLDHL